MEAYSKDTYFMNILKQVEAETRILQSKEHIQHGTTTVYEHCVQVAYESYLFAKEHQLKVEMEQLIRGALLHDYFLYDWHNQLTPHHLHGFFHPGVALRNASMDVELTPVEHFLSIQQTIQLSKYFGGTSVSGNICFLIMSCSIGVNSTSMLAFRV